jgi:ABC-2 type transport system permease protein
MSNIIKLVKLQADNKLDLFKSDPRKRLIAIGKFLLILFLITVIGYLLSLRIFFLGIYSNIELISFVITITQIVSLIFAIGYVISDLYLNKDNVLLMVLPVSPNQVFISKMIVLYLRELIMNTLYTGPLLIIVGMSYSEVNWLYFTLLPVLLVILPLLPLALAAALSVPIMIIVRFLSKYLAVWSTVIFGLVAAGFVLYMKVINFFTIIFNSEKRRVDALIEFNNMVLKYGKWNWPSYQLSRGLIYISETYWFAIFMLLIIIIFTLGIILVRPLYFKISMSTYEDSGKKTAVYRRKNEVKSPFVSLLQKEIKMVFRSPNYLFQYFLYVILMPIIVYAYDSVLLPFTKNAIGNKMVIGAHVLIVSIMAMLSNIVSASALSREGGTFYIMKVTPVDLRLQSLVKIVFNMIFSIPMIILTAIVSLKFIDLKYVLVLTPAVIFGSLGHMFLSFEFDLKKPMVDWYDTDEISKVGGATFKSILSGLFIALVMGLYVFGSASIGTVVELLLISIIFCAYRAYILYLRIAYCYERIEV